ncbi:MAG: Flp pilus assembly protein CpaB [Bryobacteraceae bacterium]
MKKNLAPLIGIAFVVAIISTGIFYGLFVKPMAGTQGPAQQALILVAARDLPRGSTVTAADVKLASWPSASVPPGGLTRAEQAKGLMLTDDHRQGEPLTEAKLASPATGAGAGLGIPAGFRAVTVSVHETAGVLAMLRPGHKVDVQVVSKRQSETEVRAILENIQVLHTQTHGEGQNTRSVVTLLVPPNEADMLALADAGARIRIVLRNPLDEQRTSRSTWALERLLRTSSSPAAAPPPVDGTGNAQSGRGVSGRGGYVLWVRVASASSAALKTLETLEATPATGEGMRIAALKEGSDDSIFKLQQRKQVQILSSYELTAAGQQPVLIEAGAPNDLGLRVRFSQGGRAGSGLRLRVEPEVVQKSNRRRFESELDIRSGQSILITGLAEGSSASDWIERLYPGRGGASAADLVVLVTPRARF